MTNLFKITDKTDSKKILKVYTYSRLLLLLIMFYCKIIYSGDINIALNFDGQNYFNIGKYGYIFKYQCAFFPMIPILINISLRLFNSYIPLIIIFYIITYLTGVGIYNLSREYYSNNNLSKILTYIWFFSPISIYTTVLYTEGLYCFLTVCILFLYKKKEKPLLMGVLMGLLVCTRSTGSLLFFVLFVCIVIDYFYNKKRNLLNEIKYILTIYIPATIISCLYPLYLQLKLGNWKYFIDVQYECWSGEKSNFIKNLFREIDIIVNGEFANMDIWVKMQFLSNTIISYILLIIIIILIYFAIKNKEVFKKKELILFLVATLVVCYSVSKKIQAPSTSYYRYFLSCMSLYLLPNNEKIAKYMLNIGFLINLFISTCHCLHTIIF